MSVFSVLAEVLFIGHMLIGPHFPGMVETGLAGAGQPKSVGAQVWTEEPGDGLPFSALGYSVGIDARAALATGRVQEVILSAQWPLGQPQGFARAAQEVQTWANAVHGANPDSRIWLYEAWPLPVPLLDREKAQAWRVKIAEDLPLWQELAAGKAQLLPIAQGFARLSIELEAGRVPGMRSLGDVFNPSGLPNGRGMYFAALLQVAALTEVTPLGLPERLFRVYPARDWAVTAPQAAALQAIAWQVVNAAKVDTLPVKDLAAPIPAPAEFEPVASASVPAVTDLPFVHNPRGILRPGVAFGLAGVNDWSVQQPFLDVMKTARPWSGHLPGQWGGWDEADLSAAGALDAQGWPKFIPPGLTGLSTLILTDLPPDAGLVGGRYVVTYEGAGELRLEGRAEVMESAPRRMVFHYSPGPGAVVLSLVDIDAADPIRNIRILQERHEAAYLGGGLFNPDWLARLQGAEALRFMDWMATNDSTLSARPDRPLPADYTWARKGVPIEVIVALANQLQADPWLTIPHLAEDALIADIAQIVAAGLAPERKAYVEYSNEVWNWQFAQATWAEAKAKARWGHDHAWVQFYALRAAEVMQIWSKALPKDRLVRVISSQTGWLGLEEQILTAPLVMAEGRPAPATGFDAYAVTGYFAGGLGAEAKVPMVKEWLAQGEDYAEEKALAELRNGAVSGQSADSLEWLLQEVLPHHAKVAKAHGLDLLMYEGGSHVVGTGHAVEDAALTAFYTRLNYSEGMGGLYADLLKGWSKLSKAPFNAFVDVYVPGKWGSWGALRHLDDENPRWRALAGRAGQGL